MVDFKITVENLETLKVCQVPVNIKEKKSQNSKKITDLTEPEKTKIPPIESPPVNVNEYLK